MVDSYIDPFETHGYGRNARDRMARACLGRIPALDGMIRFAMEAQERADAEMADAIRRHPAPPSLSHRDQVMAEARDLIVQFGTYLDALKGRPLDPRRVFQTDARAALPWRRLPRLIARVEHILAEIRAAGLAIRDRSWQRGFTAIHRKLTALDAWQRARPADLDLSPDLRLVFARWLAVYRGNQHLLRGFLTHLGEPELLPLLFDDLAEASREPPPPAVRSSIPPGPPSVTPVAA